MNSFVLAECMIAYRALALLYNNRPKGSTMRLGPDADRFTSEVSISIPKQAWKWPMDKFSESLLEPAIRELAADMDLHSGVVHPLLRRQFVMGMPEIKPIIGTNQQRASDDDFHGRLLAIFSPDFLSDANICRIIVNYDVEEIPPEASRESTKGENQ